MIELVLCWGIVNWIATTVLVDGVIFDTPREWLRAHSPAKLGYLVTCHLCCGCWVGFLTAWVAGGPLLSGVAGVIANGLLYKGVGHFILELVGWLRKPAPTPNETLLRVMADFRDKEVDDLVAVLEAITTTARAA